MNAFLKVQIKVTSNLKVGIICILLITITVLLAGCSKGSTSIQASSDVAAESELQTTEGLARAENEFITVNSDTETECPQLSVAEQVSHSNRNRERSEAESNDSMLVELKRDVQEIRKRLEEISLQENTKETVIGKESESEKEQGSQELTTIVDAIYSEISAVNEDLLWKLADELELRLHRIEKNQDEVLIEVQKQRIGIITDISSLIEGYFATFQNKLELRLSNMENSQNKVLTDIQKKEIELNAGISSLIEGYFFKLQDKIELHLQNIENSQNEVIAILNKQNDKPFSEIAKMQNELVHGIRDLKDLLEVSQGIEEINAEESLARDTDFRKQIASINSSIANLNIKVERMEAAYANIDAKLNQVSANQQEIISILNKISEAESKQESESESESQSEPEKESETESETETSSPPEESEADEEEKDEGETESSPVIEEDPIDFIEVAIGDVITIAEAQAGCRYYYKLLLCEEAFQFEIPDGSSLPKVGLFYDKEMALEIAVEENHLPETIDGWVYIAIAAEQTGTIEVLIESY